MVKQKSAVKRKRVASRAKARSICIRGLLQTSSCKASCKATCKNNSRRRSRRRSKRISKCSSAKRKSERRKVLINICGGALEDIIIPNEEIPIANEKVPAVVHEVVAAPHLREKVHKPKRGEKAKSYICTPEKVN